jgi:hypothetical protein
VEQRRSIRPFLFNTFLVTPFLPLFAQSDEDDVSGLHGQRLREQKDPTGIIGGLIAGGEGTVLESKSLVLRFETAAGSVAMTTDAGAITGALSGIPGSLARGQGSLFARKRSLAALSSPPGLKWIGALSGLAGRMESRYSTSSSAALNDVQEESAPFGFAQRRPTRKTVFEAPASTEGNP